jgi:catechol 2,3-dioxygenase-like lactoylglutathione lyase family enzyme
LSPPEIALDHVQLTAPPGCEPAAREFYGRLLELPEIEKPPGLRPDGGAWFALGSGQIHIGVEHEFVPARKGHPAMRVAVVRLDALAARLTEAGAPVDWDQRIGGVRRFFTADPWGNRLEFLADGDAGSQAP